MNLERAYVGLGSNLQDPVRQLRQAAKSLGDLPESSLYTISSLYESKPLVDPDTAAVDTEPQELYVNAVAVVDTRLTARMLLEALQSIEIQQGRVRTRRWGPRTLDLDLLMFGRQEIREVDLVVPHPELPKRAFVLYPLYEIEPALVIPGFGPLQGLVENCNAEDLKKLAVFP